MKQVTTIKFSFLAFFSLFFLPLAGLSAIQKSENFDASSWPYTTSTSVSTNFTNSITGWAIQDACIYHPTFASASNYWTSASNSCAIRPSFGTSSAISPFLSNGVGSVFFSSRGHNTSPGFIVAVEISTNGVQWTTNSFVTNTISLPWAQSSAPINTLTGLYVRLRATGGDSIGYLDDISITYPTPQVTINSPTTNPLRPTDQDPVTNSVTVVIQSVPDSFTMTNYWREWPTTNWSQIVMTSNSPTLYTAASAIPGKSIGALVEYYARASFSGNNITNTATSITNNYIVTPKSSYTNLSVIGQLNSSLGNGANYQWQGVIQVTSNNPTFQFRGTSNATTTTWGDMIQSVTNIPLYGFAEVTSSNITLNTTNNGSYLFAFNETNLEYSVRSCTYENFNTWTSSTFNASGIYTNNQWILSSGNTSNDTSRVFSGTGRSAIIETNGWLQTPYLSNGVGQVSFWYRNWSTTGAPTGKFTVQSGDSNAANWVTLGTVSNIVSTNYLFFSAAANNRDSKYVRILNTNATTRLCLDEVVIAQPGAGVSGISATPTNATILDPITIAIDLTPYNGASISNVIAWYQIGTNGQWESGIMTNTAGGHYELSTSITGVPTNGLQYAIQCFFSGFQASSPIFFPTGGTSFPASVSVSIPNNNRNEPFDDSSWPYTTVTSVSTNLTNSITGWAIQNAVIYHPTFAGASNFWTSASNSCAIRPSFGTSAAISPFLSNGVGSVFFTSRGHNTSPGFIVAVEISTNGVQWDTNAFVTNTISLPWTQSSVPINTLTGLYVRLRAAGGDAIGYLDDIRITYPPANVAITNVYINPGYPVAGQTFTGSCDVVSLNPYFPAYNIKPTFNYWPLAAGGTTISVPMNRVGVVGTTYNFSMVTNTSIIRDTPYGYNVSVTFDGYYGSAAEKKSPLTNSPSGSFTNRAYSSTYGNIGALINDTTHSARLLTNGIWQGIITASSVSSNFSIQGLGYSAGSGYSSNVISYGNSNSWQTAVPLADIATTGQTISVNLTNGQYALRFDETTGQYILQRCVWQDFDKPGEDGTLYKQTSLSSSAGGAQQDFDDWTVNTTRSRTETFEGYPWTNYVNKYISGDGNNFFLGYSQKVVTATGEGYVLQTLSNVTIASDSFIAHASDWGQYPLRGIGQVSLKFCATTNKIPAEIDIFLADPSRYPEASQGETNYTTFKIDDSWRNSTPISIISGITNMSYTNIIVDVNSNVTKDIIYSQRAGTQSLNIASVSVSEWYNETLQTNIDGWVGSEYWIETNSVSTYGNACRMDTTKANNPANQFIMSPKINGGIKYIEFFYSGAPSLSQNPPTNISVNFNVELSANPTIWTNTLDTISTNFINNTMGTNYYRYFRALQTPQAGLYVRIKNSTAKPGALLLDRINIPGFATTNDWYVNNAAVQYRDQQYPPAPRQYYRGVAYLNNTRTTNSMASGVEFPDTNSYPLVRTPLLIDGIGEISFRYRNWATNAPLYPARLVLQAAEVLTGNESDWKTTITTITNIINTNEYLYFSTSVFDTTNRYVRIYNDDTYTTSVGRVCLDEILVTAPLASSLSLSNLTITPEIPLYSNVVEVSVDVNHLFLNPTNISLTASYGTSTNYAGLASATLSSLPMSCITTNLSIPGEWYRYKTTTPIPTNAIDTYVKYSVSATFGGYHAAAMSPVNNKSFAIHPTWLAPLDTINGTNIAYYLVFACPTGSVWINEMNIRDATTVKTQYVEICGISGIDLHNWTLQILTTAATTQDVYSVTNSYILPNSTNGFGFWTIGDTNAPIQNMTLTNALPASGGIRLIRNSGVYADALSYGTIYAALTNSGFRFIGADPNTRTAPLALIGTGNNVGSFGWTNYSGLAFTPNAINPNQILIGVTGESTPPYVAIISFWINTNIWIECSGTNNWIPAPYYSTNLINTNTWTAIGDYTSTYPSISPSNTYRLNFARLTNSSLHFFKVITTPAP